MVYAGRSRDSLPFVDEVDRFGDHVEIRTDDVSRHSHRRRPAGRLPGRHGRLRLRAGADADRDPGDWPDATMSNCTSSGSPHPRWSTAREFAVTVASSGATVRVGADETLLSALRRAEVTAPYSCQQGFCGTCRTRVLDGDGRTP